MFLLLALWISEMYIEGDHILCLHLVPATPLVLLCLFRFRGPSLSSEDKEGLLK